MINLSVDELTQEELNLLREMRKEKEKRKFRSRLRKCKKDVASLMQPLYETTKTH